MGSVRGDNDITFLPLMYFVQWMVTNIIPLPSDQSDQ